MFFQETEQFDEDSTFLEIAKRGYDNAHLKTIDEFVEDFNRFRYVKRLLNRYSKTGELKERLILNHLILIFNVFDSNTAIWLLYQNNNAESIPALNSFLVFLNRIVYESNVVDVSVLNRLNNI